MNKDAVFLAWGPANDIRKGSKDSKPYEAWTYVGYDIVWDYTASFFRHRHHRNFYHPCDAGYYEPTAYYVPYAAGRVEFLNERVTGFDWKAR
ncbi:MAG: hypothetical protein R3F11_25190 [Verrucomicrobiales bacterium]